MIQLNHVLLRSFIACIDAKGFGRAAERLHLSPATISTHIARLEAEIDAVLFLRTTRHLALSREGERLESYARRILRLHDEAAEAFRTPEISGAITIAAPDDYIAHFLPNVLERFAILYPRADLKVICAQSTTILPMVEDGRVDLAIATRSGETSSGRLLRREPLVWIAARDRLVLERRPLPVATFEPGSQARKLVLAALERSNIAYRATYESASLAGMLTLVEAGLAVAAVARLSAPPHLILPEAAGGLPSAEALDIVLLRAPMGNGALKDAIEALIEDEQHKALAQSG